MKHPDRHDWNRLPVPIRLLIVGHVFRHGHLPQLRAAFAKKLARIDLWLFPPLAFIACIKAANRFMPPHPLAPVITLTAGFSAWTLVIVILRPAGRRIADWM